jgi:L-alanine-DL-glutamate epimerase-like enolase superfamily enzyme
MTTIESVRVRPLDLPLREPFEIALGVQESARNLLVRVETADGVVGVGEGSPLAPVTGETRESAVEIARAAGDVITGRPLADYRSVIETVRETFPGNGAAVVAVEMAVLDAYCRRRDLPLAALFGGEPTGMRTDMTVPIVEHGVAAQRARDAVGRGYDTIKIKCGDTVDESVDRVTAVADAVPNATLTVDGNQGFSPSETRRFAEAVAAAGVTLAMVEQPVAASDIQGMVDVRRALAVPIAADEAVVTPTDATTVCRAGAADVLNLKLAKSGLLESAAIAAVARAADRDVMIGCMLESAVGVHASAHLVSGLGGISHVDLDANRLLADDVGTPSTAPEIEPDGPGHGIDPDVAWAAAGSKL